MLGARDGQRFNKQNSTIGLEWLEAIRNTRRKFEVSRVAADTYKFPPWVSSPRTLSCEDPMPSGCK